MAAVELVVSTYSQMEPLVVAEEAVLVVASVWLSLETSSSLDQLHTFLQTAVMVETEPPTAVAEAEAAEGSSGLSPTQTFLQSLVLPSQQPAEPAVLDTVPGFQATTEQTAKS